MREFMAYNEREEPRSLARTMDGDEVCLKFHRYPFLEDEEFLSGWLRIRKCLEENCSDLELKYLQAKLFYYSKRIEPVELQTYLNWLNRTEKLNPSAGTSGADEENIHHHEHSRTENKIAVSGSPEVNTPNTGQSKLETSSGTLSTNICSKDSVNIGKKIISSETENAASKKNILGDTGVDCETEVAQNPTDQITSQPDDEASSKVNSSGCVPGRGSNESGSDKPIIDTSVGDCIEGKAHEERSGRVHDMSITQQMSSVSLESSFKSTISPELCCTSASSVPGPSGSCLTFSEVMEHVEAGIPIPGVVDLSIEPTNTDVTASEVGRCKKPWEKVID